MRRHGVTLIELLIVLAIIGALLALVFPVMSSRLSERAFVSTADRLRAQLLLTRAEAMRTGSPLEVVYLEEESRIEVRRFQPGRLDSGAGRASSRAGSSGNASFETQRPARARPNPGRAMPGDALEEEDLVYDASWATLSLGDDMRIVNQLPEEFDLDRDMGASLDLSSDQLSEFESFDAIGGDSFLMEPAAPVRITVYLGDGSSLLSKSLWLLDGDGRRSMLEINPWTGIPSFTRQANADASTSSEDDMRFDDPLADDEDDARERSSGPERADTSTPTRDGGFGTRDAGRNAIDGPENGNDDAPSDDEEEEDDTESN